MDLVKRIEELEDVVGSLYLVLFSDMSGRIYLGEIDEIDLTSSDNILLEWDNLNDFNELSAEYIKKMKTKRTRNYEETCEWIKKHLKYEYRALSERFYSLGYGLGFIDSHEQIWLMMEGYHYQDIKYREDSSKQWKLIPKIRICD